MTASSLSQASRPTASLASRQTSGRCAARAGELRGPAEGPAFFAGRSLRGVLHGKLPGGSRQVWPDSAASRQAKQGPIESKAAGSTEGPGAFLGLQRVVRPLSPERRRVLRYILARKASTRPSSWTAWSCCLSLTRTFLLARWLRLKAGSCSWKWTTAKATGRVIGMVNTSAIQSLASRAGLAIARAVAGFLLSSRRALRRVRAGVSVPLLFEQFGLWQR